jgi:uncharacterized protein
LDVDFGDGFPGVLTGTPERGAVLVSHGAGGTLNTPLLVQTSEQLAKIGFMTLRWNFGYVKARRSPSAGGKRERVEMEEAISFLRERGREYRKDTPIILLGKSFGARVSTFVGSERTDLQGYVFYGLPLVGASKTSKPRDWSHLGKLSGKAVFITGDRDRLCPLPELTEAQHFLSIPFQSIIVPGDHSYKPKGEQAALAACIEWMDNSF